jgi:hypothetical protein
MKKSVWKWIGIIAIIGIIIGGFVAYKTWNAPHRDVRDEKGIVVTAQNLLNAYVTDEKQADSVYLDNAIEVSGEVTEISENAQGKTVISLKTDDPMAGIRCTMIESVAVKTGDQIKIKGKCTGYLMDVTLIDCYLLK